MVNPIKMAPFKKVFSCFQNTIVLTKMQWKKYKIEQLLNVFNPQNTISLFKSNDWNKNVLVIQSEAVEECRQNKSFSQILDSLLLYERVMFENVPKPKLNNKHFFKVFKINLYIRFWNILNSFLKDLNKIH